MEYDGERPEENAPAWMEDKHSVFFRDPKKVVTNMLANPDFNGSMDYAALQEFDANQSQRFKNFMSGNWAWEQSNKIAVDPTTHGSTFVPVILGSDKTTVSVATGQTDYYPLYLSIGNVHNHVRRARRNAVALIGFLAIPKSKQEYADDVQFRKFRRRLFHSSLSHILSSLKDGMTTPVLSRCADGHFRKIIYGLGPYIADYPEQVLLASVVQNWCAKCTANSEELDKDQSARPRSHAQTANLMSEPDITLEDLWVGWGIVGDVDPFTMDFPRADIHELLAPDLLHQIIKGTFKDHLVTWVTNYINLKFSKRQAKKVLDDIDKRISVAPPFIGLRRFPQGRGFKQWTGDDSKALMKVYLPAISGYVPGNMVKALRAFLDFCYLARRNIHTTETITQMEEALAQFHKYCEIFQSTGACPKGFQLPRQHSLKHYVDLIKSFGAPNGLCSSITESKHIVAVKEPWRRSSRFKALGQMLMINQRNDKLAAARVDFEARGMLKELQVDSPNDTESDDESELTRSDLQAVDDNDTVSAPGGASGNSHGIARDGAIDIPTQRAFVDMAVKIQPSYPRSLDALAAHVRMPLRELTTEFLEEKLRLDQPGSSPSKVTLSSRLKVHVHHSLACTFFAPSDPCGSGGMHREFIRATSSWWDGPARYDCALIPTEDAHSSGVGRFDIARVKLLFSFKYNDVLYPCALVHWYGRVFNEPEETTGLWIVEEQSFPDERPFLEVVHIERIYRAAHLIPVFDCEDPVPEDLTFDQTLSHYKSFYLNKYVDGHMFESLNTL
ncbi:hypothetical protein BXZ70DRAFT_1070857 [Cristinia sonorae]|uniref:Uncharacterized protein n=1 Tax=Cristinia sonorae TaxID=1940300 RepID=A0A8K0UU00_9AGAR|nr:hypothetical protein BXZ70DRAFT_1070857 [Cristinia sonorae]